MNQIDGSYYFTTSILNHSVRPLRTDQNIKESENQTNIPHSPVSASPKGSRGVQIPEGDGLNAQQAEKALLNLCNVAITGSVEEVSVYITKQVMNKIASKLEQKYSIKSTAAEWGEKVVSRAKARIPHTPFLCRQPD
ncbi:hypothetical protein Hrd1104_00180 [Halorhabdus sp. CBA1104]|uniref:hypothetical protein n=1 Tax=Halorhabdus sp. CBA1104 TaxID=1380432 RepID=UPI0012B19022|nr:hypothetical protein [Halorhabdus sp. CBA1104]QGN05860.1 hypothetical protein Hrd1104_00180 [Halorhabdus sp. CBA1104]